MTPSKENNIVSVHWLNNNLEAENLLVFDASIPKVGQHPKKNKLNELQIPNSQFFDIKNVFSDTASSFPNTIPSESLFQEKARHLGVNNNSVIVVYDDKGIYSSARVWWLFKTFGHSNIYVLDGGLPSWIAHNFKTENKKQNKKPQGNFIAKYNPENVIYFKSIEAISKDKNFKIIDARSSDRFNCIVAEPRANLRSGNIPNSINLPYQQVLNNNKLKSKTELEAIFNKLAEKNQHLVFSCGSGITAAILALAATIAGYKNSVYDGSWTEYATLTTV